MNIHLRIALLLIAISLAGCASIQPVVTTASAPEPASGYVAGGFTRNKSDGLAFVIRNLDSGEEYGMSLGEDSSMPTEVKDQVTAIKLPPGRYSVSQWIAYATLTKERLKKSPVTNQYLAAPFTVKAGSVTYLGNYAISTTRTYSYPTTYTNWSIKPLPITSAEASRKFLEAYPKFDRNSFECHLCLDKLLKN